MSTLQVVQAKSLKELEVQMHKLVSSKLLPKHVDSPQKAFAIAQMGQELGLLPMQACLGIYVEPKSGRPALQADTMLGIIRRDFPQSRIQFPVLTNERVEIHVQRDANHETEKFVFTIEDAQNAGLTGKDNWKKYPRAMLRSRCVAEMARTVFPDALCGFKYTPDELGVETDEDGAPIGRDVTPPMAETRTDPVEQMQEAERINCKPPETEIVNHALEIEGAGTRDLPCEFNPDESIPEFDSASEEPARKEFSVLDELEKAKEVRSKGEEYLGGDLVDNDFAESLGDFVYNVGNPKHPAYGKKLSEMPRKSSKARPYSIYKVQAFLKGKIENSEAKGFELDPKEQMALFMIDKYIESEKENTK